MKLIFCVTLSLTLSCFNVDSIAVDVAQKRDKSEEDGYESKLTAHLDFDGLLNMVQMNEELSTIAADVFHREYSNKIFWIYDGFQFPNDTNALLIVAGMEIDANTIARLNRYVRPNRVQLSEEYIKLECGAQILNTFKYFGHLIKRIEFNSLVQREAERSELIGRLISKYSSESLGDVALYLSKECVPNYITKAITNAENVSLTFLHDNLTRSIQLNELFPALRRLYIYLRHCVRGSVHFDYHIPHLELVEFGGNHGVYESSFSGFFMKNPQIRSFTLPYANPGLVESVSNHLPQLETLALPYFDLQYQRIRFENVTTLSISYPHTVFSTAANLEFPRLETLRISYENGMHFAKHYAFLKTLNHLKHLDLYYFIMSDSQFTQFTENLSNLEELTLQCGTVGSGSLSVSTITEFLRRNEKVKQFNAINIHQYVGRELREQLKLDWDLTIKGHDLHFARKTNISL